ncbi:MAG: ribonuclease P protein component [Erysipelotrichaceae bacterium]
MKKRYRVCKSREFKAILSNKRFFASPTIVLYVKPRAQERSRVGISVSKRMGNAVKRNKIKRQVRMMVQEVYNFQEEFDTIVLIRDQYNKENYGTNRNNLLALYKKVTIRK